MKRRASFNAVVERRATIHSWDRSLFLMLRGPLVLAPQEPALGDGGVSQHSPSAVAPTRPMSDTEVILAPSGMWRETDTVSVLLARAAPLDRDSPAFRAAVDHWGKLIDDAIFERIMRGPYHASTENLPMFDPERMPRRTDGYAKHPDLNDKALYLPGKRPEIDDPIPDAELLAASGWEMRLLERVDDEPQRKLPGASPYDRHDEPWCTNWHPTLDGWQAVWFFDAPRGPACLFVRPLQERAP